MFYENFNFYIFQLLSFLIIITVCNPISTRVTTSTSKTLHPRCGLKKSTLKSNGGPSSTIENWPWQVL
jgi:hypothetical protein